MRSQLICTLAAIAAMSNAVKQHGDLLQFVSWIDEDASECCAHGGCSSSCMDKALDMLKPGADAKDLKPISAKHASYAPTESTLASKVEEAAKPVEKEVVAEPVKEEAAAESVEEEAEAEPVEEEAKPEEAAE